MDEQKLLKLPMFLAENLDVGWTFFLILVRLGAMFVLIPGLSGGPQGVMVRLPGLMAMSLAGVSVVAPIAVPAHLGILTQQVLSEIFLGGVLGMLPTFVIAGVQTGSQLASTSMGLGAGQLFDPTTQSTTTQLARIFSDLLVVSFLLVDGHHALLYAGLGMGGQIVPGTFLLGVTTVDILIKQSAQVFELAVIVSAPVVMAILMTQLILGICTKLVSQLNIFIVSFPLTIGLGLILSAIVVPMFVNMGNRYLAAVDESVVDILSDAKLVD
jgi:flagellar biosynthesis protein FliR